MLTIKGPKCSQVVFECDGDDSANLVLGGSLPLPEARALEATILSAIVTNTALSEIDKFSFYVNSAPTLRLPSGGLMSVAINASTPNKSRTHSKDPISLLGRVRDSEPALTLLQQHVPELRGFQQVSVDYVSLELCPTSPKYLRNSYDIVEQPAE